LSFKFKDDFAPSPFEQIEQRAMDAAMGLTGGPFIDTSAPDNRYVIRGYSVVKRDEFSRAPETIRIHDIHLDLFYVDPSLANTPEPQSLDKNRNRKGTVIILNPHENDRVELLKKSDGYPGAFVYTINKVVGYEQDHVTRHEIAQLEPPTSQEEREAVVAAKHMILVGEVKDADSFGTAPVTTMLDKARLNGSFHPNPDDPVWGDRLCQAYNCPLCGHINYRQRRVAEEGGRLSGTFTLGQPAFSKLSRNRDERNYLKRDIMPVLEVLESSMSLASLASIQVKEWLEQQWNKKKRPKQATDNNDGLEESEEAEEEK
jgi:hypothetical protein